MHISLVDTITETRRASVRYLLADIALLHELLSHSALSADPNDAAALYLKALSGFRAVTRIADRLHLKHGQRVTVDAELTELRDKLLAKRPAPTRH